MSEIEFSLCAIYKNEEKNLEVFLKRHIDIFEELVLVDTGSTDRSNEITSAYGVPYHFFQWVKDFSKARNYSLSKATKPWIIVLDMDEHVLKEDIDRLKTIIRETGKDVFSLQQINFVDSREDINWKTIETLPSAFHECAAGYITSPLYRVFRNHKAICFNGVIHELVGDSVNRLKLSGMITDIPIYHYGWIDRGRSEDEKKQKEKAYNEMIKKAWETDQSPKMAFYYIKTLNDPREKIKLCYRMIRAFPEVKQFWEIIATNSADLKQWGRALSYAEKGLVHHPGNVSLLATSVRCLNETGHPDQALEIVKELLKNDPWNPVYWYENFRSLVMLNRKEEARELAGSFPSQFPRDLADELRKMVNE